MPPTTYWGMGAGWEDQRNRLLVSALRLYDQSLCPSCSQDRGASHADAMDGWYEVKTEICYSCASLELHEKNMKHAPPGLKLYTVVSEGAPRLQG